MTLLMFSLFCFGFAAIIAFSKITQPIRDYLQQKGPWAYKFVSCPMCMSFWIGLMASFILPAYVIPTSLPLFNAFLASASSFILHALVWRLALRNKTF